MSNDNIENNAVDFSLDPSQQLQQQNSVNGENFSQADDLHVTNPIKALKHAFKNYVNFKGRSCRKSFWMFYLAVLIMVGIFYGAMIGTAFLIPVIGFTAYIAIGMILILLLIAVSFAFLLPTLAYWVRRLHDFGKSGKLLLLIYAIGFGGIVLGTILLSGLIFFASTIFFFAAFIYIGCVPSKNVDNKYPKAKKLNN